MINALRWVIADDESIPLLVLKRILIHAGHFVVGEASDGLQAVVLCDRHRPDAVALDISMPGCTGDEAARTILREELARHVVIASSNVVPSVTDSLRALGVRLVTKPYHTTQFLKEIADFE